MRTNYNYCINYIDTKTIFLQAECIKDEIYYKVYFKIEDGNVTIDFITTNKCNFENAEYDLYVRKLDINENDISIDVDCDIKFDFGDKISFNINKTFNKKYDTGYNSTINYINFLIKEKKLYNNSDFIYDNIDTLFEIIRTSERANQNIEYIECENKLDKETIIKESQNFLDKVNIDININELIHNNSILFIDKNGKDNGDGMSYYDNEKNKRMIKIKESNDIKELVTLVHEILHYSNQPIDNKRSVASEYLTEVVSYSYELILADRILDSKYKEDAQCIFNNTIITLSSCSYLLYPALLSIKLFKENGIVTAKDVNEYCNFENYIKEMEEYIKKEEYTQKNVWNCLGYFLAIYNYIEYKKDNKFIDKLYELNNSINTKSFIECLNIIGIDNIDDMFNKGIKNIDEYHNMLVSKPKIKVK